MLYNRSSMALLLRSKPLPCAIGFWPKRNSVYSRIPYLLHPQRPAVGSKDALEVEQQSELSSSGFSTSEAAAAAALDAHQQPEAEADVTTAELEDNSGFSDLSVEEPPGFEELGVDKLLVASLAESGIELPSPIQEAALPVLLQGRNAAVQSYTGSGKTLAYLLPALTLALRRAEAAFKRQQAAAAAAAKTGRRPALSEADAWSVQVLVVAPSQELAMQICRVAGGLLPRAGRSAVQQAIGGASMRRQMEALAEHQPLMVVGTPGRLADLIRSGALRLHRCPLLVLDEADQLLGDVYAEDMEHIISHCGKRLGTSSSSSSSSSGSNEAEEEQPAAAAAAAAAAAVLAPTQRQTVLVSATLWAGGLVRFNKWCPEPLFVTMGGATPTLSPEDVSNSDDVTDDMSSDDAKSWGWGAKGWEGPASVVQQGPKTQGMAGGAEGAALIPSLPPNLEHMYLVVNPLHRADAVRRALYALNVGMGLAFLNWQQRLKDVAAKMDAKKIDVGQLHGEMTPSDRAAVLEATRRGAFQLLLVSDVAARGLDLPQIDVVFNVELPSNAAHYAHRAGRTGRMGAPGLVLTLIAPGERFVVERLSKRLGVPILECHLAGGELVVGPPPAKDKKKKDKKKQQEAAAAAAAAAAEAEAEQQRQQRREQAAAAAAALAERQQSNSMASSSSSSGGGGGGGVGQKLAADSSSSSSSVAAAGAGAAGAGAAGAGAADGFDDAEGEGEYIIDEDDELEVEGDEPEQAFRQRVKQELQRELEDIRQEKQALKEQRRAAAAAAAGGEEQQDQRQKPKRVVRRVSGPVPKGSPQQAALMAIKAIEADEKAKKGKSKLPAELVAAAGGAAAAEQSGAKKRQGSKPRVQQQQLERQRRTRSSSGAAGAAGRRPSSSSQ